MVNTEDRRISEGETVSEERAGGDGGGVATGGADAAPSAAAGATGGKGKKRGKRSRQGHKAEKSEVVVKADPPGVLSLTPA